MFVHQSSKAGSQNSQPQRRLHSPGKMQKPEQAAFHGNARHEHDTNALGCGPGPSLSGGIDYSPTPKETTRTWFDELVKGEKTVALKGRRANMRGRKKNNRLLRVGFSTFGGRR
ncbi:hypothetical protein KM043_007786 [Ampulex compressa]|nr:hypothetical protein KM043_007786 [Ampulex compressa]